MPVKHSSSARLAAERRRSVLEAAHQVGLIDGARNLISGRLQKQLIAAAKMRSRITSDTELLEYALARVALEDDFGAYLSARRGRIKPSIDLEF